MKHFCLFALLLFSGLAAQAQEKENRDAQGRIVRGPYETNRLFDYIFVGIPRSAPASGMPDCRPKAGLPPIRSMPRVPTATCSRRNSA